MGLVNFTGFGDIANAGLGDGVEGRVHDAIEALPRNLFYWLPGDNPTATVPYAKYHDGRIVIDVLDDGDLRGGRPAIGVKMIPEAVVQKADEKSTIFGYQGLTYEVRHLTMPFYGN